MSKSESTDKGSGARLIVLLKLIGESSGDCSLKDLAAGTGMPASSVHRLLQILVRGGLVERGEGTSYRAGRELFSLSAKILNRMHYTAAVRPLLRQLWETWRETMVFCIHEPAHHRVVVAERLLTPHPLRHMLEPYTELSLPWGALGRAVLAYLAPDNVALAIAAAPEGPIAGAQVMAQDRLMEQLAEIRVRGCAVYRSQEADFAGIAAPVFRGGDVVVGSIGLVVPPRRFDQLDIDRVSADVMAAARQLSETFGHGDAGI